MEYWIFGLHLLDFRNLGGCNENIFLEGLVFTSLRVVNLKTWKLKRNAFALQINGLISICQEPPSVTYITKDSSIIFIAIKNMDTESGLQRFNCEQCVVLHSKSHPITFSPRMKQDEIGNQICFWKTSFIINVIGICYYFQ